jgi:tRNA 2-thiouridine synthesizing protein E
LSFVNRKSKIKNRNSKIAIMSQKTFAGVTVDVNEEGYFTNPAQWTKELAVEVAKEEGIQLTDKHLAVLDFLRERFAKGDNLTIRSVGNSGIVDIKGFYGLFPGAPMKKAAKIAGIPKPSSCV